MVVSSPQCGKKIELFFQFSPWRDTQLRHFSGYPFGASRKKRQPFSITQPKIKQPHTLTEPFSSGRSAVHGAGSPCPSGGAPFSLPYGDIRLFDDFLKNSF